MSVTSVTPSVQTPVSAKKTARYTQTVLPRLDLLKVIGYGTGVHVSLMERGSPASRGTYRSPWAVKHIRSAGRSGAGSTAGSPQLKSAASTRLRAEAELLRRLQHPCVVGYRATSSSAGSVMLMMEAAQCSLMELIEQQQQQNGAGDGPMCLTKMSIVGADIGAALHYLHSQHRLLHGDVKSANVLVFDNFSRVKLCDFGVCVQLGENMCADVSEYVGTEMWAPPEVIDRCVAQKHRVVTDRADVFSYALTLWEMFAVDLPHSCELDQIVTETGDYCTDDDEEQDRDVSFTEILLQPPALPVYCNDIMEKYHVFVELYSACVSKEPSKRPSSLQCTEVFKELRDKLSNISLHS